jgi:hypothetical protein
LATHRNALRQIPNRLPLRNRTRRNRHILVMSPEPRKGALGNLRRMLVSPQHGFLIDDHLVRAKHLAQVWGAKLLGWIIAHKG